jgi:hypothetical protein
MSTSTTTTPDSRPVMTARLARGHRSAHVRQMAALGRVFCQRRQGTKAPLPRTVAGITDQP